MGGAAGEAGQRRGGDRAIPAATLSGTRNHNNASLTPTLIQIKSERSLAGAPFLEIGGLQGYPRVTEYWPQLSMLMMRLNPKQAPTIRKQLHW